MGPDLKPVISGCYPDLETVDRAIPKGFHVPFTVSIWKYL